MLDWLFVENHVFYIMSNLCEINRLLGSLLYFKYIWTCQMRRLIICNVLKIRIPPIVNLISVSTISILILLILILRVLIMAVINSIKVEVIHCILLLFTCRPLISFMRLVVITIRFGHFSSLATIHIFVLFNWIRNNVFTIQTINRVVRWDAFWALSPTSLFTRRCSLPLSTFKFIILSLIVPSVYWGERVVVRGYCTSRNERINSLYWAAILCFKWWVYRILVRSYITIQKMTLLSIEISLILSFLNNWIHFLRLGIPSWILLRLFWL